MSFETVTTKSKWSIDSDGMWISFLVPERSKIAAQTLVSSFTDKLFDLTVKRHREKRSLDANAYCWLLINEIANVLRVDKDSVYLSMLKRYGQS